MRKLKHEQTKHRYEAVMDACVFERSLSTSSFKIIAILHFRSTEDVSGDWELNIALGTKYSATRYTHAEFTRLTLQCTGSQFQKLSEITCQHRRMT